MLRAFAILLLVASPALAQSGGHQGHGAAAQREGARLNLGVVHVALRHVLRAAPLHLHRGVLDAGARRHGVRARQRRPGAEYRHEYGRVGLLSAYSVGAAHLGLLDELRELLDRLACAAAAEDRGCRGPPELAQWPQKGGREGTIARYCPRYSRLGRAHRS